MVAEELWDMVKAQLRAEVPRTAYDRWIRDTEGLELADDTLAVGVASDYACAWLGDRVASTAERALTGIVRAPVKVRFELAREAGGEDETGEATSEELPWAIRMYSLPRRACRPAT